VDELPDDFAIALGQIMYLGGRVEYLLGQLIPSPDGQPSARGLSGGRLIEVLRKIADPGSDLSEIIDGYEQQQEWRNHLAHGAHTYANGTIWTWRIPAGGKGNTALSFQFSIETLRQFAQNWQNLAAAVHGELHARAELADGEQNPT
jgi:hypothetical protein